MSLDADAIVDRRRLRRKLTFWRVAAVVVVLAAIAGAVFAIGPSTFSKPGDYVARIRIQGLIRNNQDRVEALARLSRSRAKAVIVHIDSPGGTTAGQLGTAFAWYMLSPNWADIWPADSKPAAYGTAKLRKIAVLMTDGAYNTLQARSYSDTSSPEPGGPAL